MPGLIDLSEDKHRGRAMATSYFAVETGVGLSSFLAGWLYASQAQNISKVFWAASLFALAAFLFLEWHARK